MVWTTTASRLRGGPVRLILGAGRVRVLTAQQLERGDSDFVGRFGEGQGKWQLFVSSSTPIQVMNLMLSETGNLTNHSGSSLVSADPGFRARWPTTSPSRPT